MSAHELPFVGFERGYFLDIQCFFPNKQLIGHKILSGPCNIRCYYCHRKDFLDKLNPLIPINKILRDLSKQAFYNTIVVTGGEITLYYEAAIKILKHLRAKGINTLFSTNGSFPSRVKEMIPFSNTVKIDVKGPKSMYKYITGFDIYSSVLQSIALAANNINVEVKILLHSFTKPNHINQILRDIFNVSGMPSNLAIEFQPVRDFLREGFYEPNVESLMNICANAYPLPAITLLKHYGEKERIYRLTNRKWEIFREKEIPLRFKWQGKN